MASKNNNGIINEAAISISFISNILIKRVVNFDLKTGIIARQKYK